MNQSSEEIVHINLVRALWKRKIFIIVLTISAMIISFALNTSKTPLYEIETIIAPGMTTNNNLLDEPEVIMFMVKKRIFNSAIGERLNLDTLNAPQFNFNAVKLKEGGIDTNLISISMKYPDKKLGEKILEELTHLLSEKYVKKTDRSKKLIDLELQKKKAEFEKYTLEMKTLTKSRNANGIVSDKLDLEIKKLKSEIGILSLSKEIITPLEIISGPKSSGPVKTKSKYNIILISCLALLFGALIAISLEYIKEVIKPGI